MFSYTHPTHLPFSIVRYSQLFMRFRLNPMYFFFFTYFEDYERLAHTGSTAGYKAMMSLVPEAQVGVFTVMTGEDTSYIHRSALQNFLLDWALGLPKSWINTTTICSFPEPWRRSPSQSSPPILNSSTTLNMSLFEVGGDIHIISGSCQT